VGKRRGRVYVDFGQNRRGQTVVPPSVVRPRPGAPVSTPLDWDELDMDLHPKNFYMGNTVARLAKYGDLFQGTLRNPQVLLPVIEGLQKNYL
jgi:bifunctional non-homologous end joining protein LigD